MRRLIVTVSSLALVVGAARAQAIGGSKVSDLPFAATPLSGSELLYVIQNGQSRKTTTGSLNEVLPPGSAAKNLGYNLQVFDPRYYGPGAKCDGTTDDYASFLAAEQAAESYVIGTMATKGGAVLVPGTGNACVISHGLALANGVGVIGTRGSVNCGTTGTVACWTSTGSWLRSTDTVNPTLTGSGSGNFVDSVNFIRTQPIPSSTPSTPYTPTNYPMEIDNKGSFSSINNVRMIAVTNGVSLDYTTGSGGGTFTWLTHLNIDAMNTSFQTINVNDTIYLADVHARSFFYAGNSNLVTYREANAVGWAMGYTDNAMVDSFECFQTASCITATDGTALGITHSGYNLQMSKLDCNLVISCITVAPGSTFSGRISDILAQQDTGTGTTATLFSLATDKIDAQINGLSVVTTGGRVMTLGAGVGGSVQIGSLNLGTAVNGTNTNGYSTNQNGLAAFSISANAKLSIGQRRVVRAATAGAFIGGAGADNVEMPTTCWSPFATASQVTVASTGVAVNLTTENFQRSNWAGNYLQVRIQAQPNVTVNAAGTGVINNSSFGTNLASAAITCSYSTAATGVQTCDSNWQDVADTGNTFGHFALTAPNATTSVFGPLMICGR